jgi:hypothetical protein
LTAVFFFTITKIDFEMFEIEPIASIHVGGLQIKSPLDIRTEKIMHLPLTKDAIAASVTDLASENAVISTEMMVA